MLRTIEASIQTLCGEVPLARYRGDALTIATINVWFDKHHQRQRYDALFALLEARQPDIVAFQEVTLEFLTQLKEKAWTAGYRWVDDHGPQLGSYGVGILSRVPMQSATYAELPSRMGRTLLCAEFNVEGRAFSFATTHLESQNENARHRAQQLQAIGELLTKQSGGFLCGDFNFSATSTAEDSQLANYEDLWSSLRPGEDGFTVDYTVNRMKESTRAPVRFDRILSFGQHSWRAEAIELFATESLADEPKLWPSDHFGLMALMHARESKG